ncbi:MATE family efflux transporter [Halobacillus locisalis]
MFAFLFQDKEFYQKMFSLAIPIAIQTLLISSLNMVDSMMIGQLGVASIAAVGAANKISSLLIVVMHGFSTGAAIFTAQYWGKRDTAGIKKILALTFVVMTVITLLFTTILLFFTESFMAIFTADPAVISIGSSYLSVVAFSYIVTAMTVLFSTVLKSMGEVKRPLYISVGAIGLNTLLNYLLIFGSFGFPEWGVEGAAIATLISRIIQALFMTWLLVKYLSLKFSRESLGAFDLSLAKVFFAVTVPSIINHVLWTLGETSFFWVYAQMGTSQLAAATLVDPLIFVFTALFVGLSDASTVMVGNNIGAGEKDKGFRYAKTFLVLSVLLSIVLGVAVTIISPFFISIYDVTEFVASQAQYILLIFAVMMAPRIINMINNVGVLRAGGDTKFVMYLDLFGVWGVGFPLAAIGAFVFEWPVYIVFLLANVHEVVRAIVGVRRTLSRKWMNNVIEEKEQIDVAK